jgi:hypothetical protein
MVAWCTFFLFTFWLVSIQRYFLFDIGINILDDIYSKCKGGFRLTENIKSKSYFKNKK